MEQPWLCGHMQLPRPLCLSVASSSKKEPGLHRLTQRGDRRETWRGATLGCGILFETSYTTTGTAVREDPSSPSLLFKGSHNPSHCVPSIGSHSSGSGAGQCPGFDLQDRPSLTGWQTTPRVPRMCCAVGPTSATAYIPQES